MRKALSGALKRFADAPALITEKGNVWTYARLEDEARKIAKEISPSTLVVIEGGNSPATIAAYIGTLLAGGVAHLAEPDRSKVLRTSFDPFHLITCVGEIAKIDIHPHAEKPGSIHPDLVLLFSTSGTTGLSKLVKITEQNILSNTLAIIGYLGLSKIDRAITSLRPSYTYGLSVINSHLLAGGALLLTDRSIQDPLFWSFAREAGATSISGVPHTYEVLAHDDRLETVPTLRQLTQAGGKLRPELVSLFAERSRRAGWSFFVMYGQTEASPRIAYLPPNMAGIAPDAIGIPIPGGELTLEDDKGQTIHGEGIEGELVYRGPNVMAGYALKRSDLAVAVALDSLKTGDLGLRRSDGLFVITGRRSRFIKPLGRRISLDEVEQLLAEKGLVVAALAKGEGLLLIFEGRQSAPSAVVAADLGLPVGLVVSRRIRSLPRLPSGKIDYSALNAPASKTVWLPAYVTTFIREVIDEAAHLLVGNRQQQQSISEIFSDVLQQRVTIADSFVSLGGDSMAYVQLSIALEEAFGELPKGWARLTIGELQEGKRTKL